MTNITPAQLHIIEHATGAEKLRADPEARMFRNHYLAGGGAIEDCRALVRLGLMMETQFAEDGSWQEWRGRMFRVTKAGLELLGIAGRS